MVKAQRITRPPEPEVPPPSGPKGDWHANNPSKTIRLPAELWAAVDDASRRTGRSRGDIHRSALYRYLEDL